MVKCQTLPEIINTSSIRGDDLRRLVARAWKALDCAQELVYPWTQLVIEPAKDWQSQGYAYCDVGVIKILIARGYAGTAEDTWEVAALLEHELDHLFGEEHSTMEEPKWWFLDASWASTLRLRVRRDAQPLPIETQIRQLIDIWALEAA